MQKRPASGYGCIIVTPSSGGSSKLKLVFGRTRAEASLLPSVASLTKHSPGLSREFPLKDCNDTILNCLAEGPMYQEQKQDIAEVRFVSRIEAGAWGM